MKISGSLDIMNQNMLHSGPVSSPATSVDAVSIPPASGQTNRSQPGSEPAPEGGQKVITGREIRQEADYINKQLESMNYSIRFSIDDKLKELVVKIVDTKTDKVIKQIPPADMLKFREKMKEMVGLLVEEKT